MDEESISRARWSVVERRLRRLEQAAGLPNPPQKGGPAMARTPQEVDALLDQLEGDAARHEGALHMQMAVNDDNTRRIDRVMDLYQRLTARIQGLSDQHDATVERVDRIERRLDGANNPFMSLMLGLVAAAAWTAVWAVLKALFGDNLEIAINGKDALVRDHPQFDDLTLAILVCGLIFILVVTIVNMIIEIVTNRRPRGANQPQQAQQPAQGNPPPQGGNQAGNNPPTQVMPQPVNAGQQGP